MRYLLQFLWKNSAFFLFLILELISFVLIVNENQHQSAVFATFSNQVGGKMFASYSNLRSYFHLRDANSLLANENANLKRQIQLLKALNDSTRKQAFGPSYLSGLFRADSSKSTFDFVSARVVSNSTNKQKNYIMLSKGSKQGVKKNMGIIGPDGIAGIVFETSDDFSTAMSLLNTKLRISAKLMNSDELGSLIWEGKSDRVGQLDAVENYVPIAIGDTIVTSGFSHIFPEGELIGTVEEFEEIPGKTAWKIQVKYFTDFSRLHRVSVCRNLNYDQQKRLETNSLKN